MRDRGIVEASWRLLRFPKKTSGRAGQRRRRGCDRLHGIWGDDGRPPIPKGSSGRAGCSPKSGARLVRVRGTVRPSGLRWAGTAGRRRAQRANLLQRKGSGIVLFRRGQRCRARVGTGDGHATKRGPRAFVRCAAPGGSNFGISDFARRRSGAVTGPDFSSGMAVFQSPARSGVACA